ncbi:MAG TPA: acyl-CoA thioesterase [Flavobacteriales bacterium]|jgi:acyl-CoA thioesterase YciA|nr:acyl-CoA thioesterase [Salibacteraceae bacterium]HAQ70930.1 acyl-CoA thioesterase [Flavobacteriales bacterium]
MQLISQRLCMEKDLGIHGNLFGGIMISWLDESAAIMAYEICHSPNMVTLKIDEVIFTKPVKMGFHLKIYGKVLRLGRSSITLLVEARKHNVYSGEETLVCSTNFTFVRIDDHGDAIPISERVREKYNDLDTSES